MTLKRKASGSFTDITTTLKRRASGAWVDIDTIRRKASGAWTIAWRRIALSYQEIIDSVGLGTAIAGYRLNSSGIVEKRLGASYTTLETWLAAGAASGYECRVTVVSGSLTTGTAGSWLSLASSREWTVQQATVGTNTCQITVEIRNATTLVVAATATIDLSADRF